jgi:hypothetical protein
MVACLHNILQGIGDSCGTTGNCQTRYATFKGCHAILEHALCAIGQSSVNITGIAQAESVGSMLRIVEHITGGLIDGYCASVGSGVGLFLAYMQLQCLETIILTCTHNLIPFFSIGDYFVLFIWVQRYEDWRFLPKILFISENMPIFANEKE